VVDRRTEISDHFMHAGAGTSMVLAYAGLIPGVIPLLALTVVVAVVAVIPLVVLGLAAAVIAAPPYGAWRLLTRARRRVARELAAAGATPRAAPYPGA
jgi:hypothetical protein